MSTVTLYYSPGACSLSDHIALKLAKIPYKLVKVDLKKKLTETGEDYTKISPTGAVPLIKFEDGQILTQNVAILTYIGDISSYPSFKPDTEVKKARLLEALASDGDLHVGVGGFVYLGAPEAGAKRRLNELEARLPASGYIFGTEEPSQSDLYTAVVLNWMVASGHSLSAWPKAEALHKKVFSLEATKEALKEEGF